MHPCGADEQFLTLEGQTNNAAYHYIFEHFQEGCNRHAAAVIIPFRVYMHENPSCGRICFFSSVHEFQPTIKPT